MRVISQTRSCVKSMKNIQLLNIYLWLKHQRDVQQSNSTSKSHTLELHQVCNTGSELHSGREHLSHKHPRKPLSLLTTLYLTVSLCQNFPLSLRPKMVAQGMEVPVREVSVLSCCISGRTLCWSLSKAQPLCDSSLSAIIMFPPHTHPQDDIEKIHHSLPDGYLISSKGIHEVGLLAI